MAADQVRVLVERRGQQPAHGARVGALQRRVVGHQALQVRILRGRLILPKHIHVGMQQLLVEAVAAHVTRHQDACPLGEDALQCLAAVEPLEVDGAGVVAHHRLQDAPEAPSPAPRRHEVHQQHPGHEGGAQSDLKRLHGKQGAAVVVARRKVEEQVGDATQAPPRKGRGAFGAHPRQVR